MAESSYQQWQISGTTGFHDLKLVQKSIPKPGSHEVLVAWKWGSLNYRDLVLANVRRVAAFQLIGARHTY